MSNSISAEQLRLLIETVNDQAVGRSCDVLEFRTSPAATAQVAVDVYFRDGGAWVSRVPEACVSLEILEAIAAAVRCGRALGRTEGKREIGDYLRSECGL